MAHHSRRFTTAALAGALAVVTAGGTSANELETFRSLPDNRLAVRRSLGVRRAVRIDATTIEVVIGLSVTPAARDAEAYRIGSFDDPAYAHTKFVRPSRAEVIRTVVEAQAPPGSDFDDFKRTVVRLTAPRPLAADKHYYVLAQGVKGLMVTGARTAADVTQGPADDGKTDAVDLAVLGLRQVEPVGPKLIKLEFGPNFSPTAWGKPESYRITVGGEQAEVLDFGRITRVGTYWPIGWPFRAIPQHEVYLLLDRAAADGDAITVRVDTSVCTAGGETTLTFRSTASLSNSIKVNQIGYLPDAPKAAYLGRWMGSFPELKTRKSPALEFDAPPAFGVYEEQTARRVYEGRSRLIHTSGTMDEGHYKYDHSGENVYLLDFTAFRPATGGRYFIAVEGVGRSLAFEVSANVYDRAFQPTAYGVFAQRCGIRLEPPYSTWRRIACHRKGVTPTTVQRLQPYDWKTFPQHVDPDHGVLKIWGGHHDAGDYNPRSHLDVAQALMDAWEIAPRKFFDGQLNIPEWTNGVPDILDEADWALRLWRGLQDDDGGVFNGTESNGDPNFIQSVELDVLGDYAFAKDAAGSFNFAGAMAQASRIWRSLGRDRDAADLLARARRAYAWGVRHPPTWATTDAERLKVFDSPRAYAAAELLRTTGEAAFNRDFLAACVWRDKPEAALDQYKAYDQSRAAWAYANCDARLVDADVHTAARAAILRQADQFIANARTMAYAFIRHPYAPINWGTGAYENWLTPVIWAWGLTGESTYRDWMIRTCDNTLGANPLNRSWIVGVGKRTIRAPLHNSRYSHLGEPVTGLQAEGPHERGAGYRVTETAYPPIRRNVACLYTFVDAHFAIAMDEGVVGAQAKSMATFGLLLPDTAGRNTNGTNKDQ